jgi:hypothetical protein
MPFNQFSPEWLYLFSLLATSEPGEVEFAFMNVVAMAAG